MVVGAQSASYGTQPREKESTSLITAALGELDVTYPQPLHTDKASS